MNGLLKQIFGRRREYFVLIKESELNPDLHGEFLAACRQEDFDVLDLANFASNKWGMSNITYATKRQQGGLVYALYGELFPDDAICLGKSGPAVSVHTPRGWLL